MDFFDNVVNKSNALIKERLSNPFGGSRSASNEGDGAGNQQQQQQSAADGATSAEAINSQTATSQNEKTGQQQQETSPLVGSPNLDGENEGDKNNSQFAAIAADAEAVAQKAAKGAKNFGNFLFSMANKAGQTVSQTAKQVKQAVESTSILTDFTREQQEFIREHGGSIQAGEMPWNDVGGSDEIKRATIKEQILSLSQDKRNFVRSPPNDSDFKFDPQTHYPIALTLLKEDPNLSKMRYELVPKLVNEDTFWRNYFYRVEMLKQISEKGEISRQGWSSSRSSSGEGPDEVTQHEDFNQGEEPSSPNYTTTSSQPLSSNPLRQTSQEIPATKTTGPTSYATAETNPGVEQLESSESRKLFAEADDLKSKLKELNIGSLDFGNDQDG